MTSSRQQKYSNPAMAVITGLRDMFSTKEVCGTLRDTDRLDGKTVFIDGASSGLGFAIATEVAGRGATTIMACRSGIPERGEEVKRLTGNKQVYMVPVDLSDLSSIRQLVTGHLPALLATLPGSPGIDIFILNAGIVPKISRKTPQGIEEMFMVNYFAKFVFIRLLMEHGFLPDPASSIQHPASSIQHPGSSIQDPASRIQHPASSIQHPASRILFVTSESHRNPVGFRWNEFGVYKEYGIRQSMELYGYYKLLLVTFARELSRRLNPGNEGQISVFAMCPGPVNSNIAREAPAVFQPLLKLVFSLFFKSPGKAAIPVIYLAASDDLTAKPFDYLYLMSRQPIDEKAEDPENGQMLWNLSGTLFTTLSQPG